MQRVGFVLFQCAYYYEKGCMLKQPLQLGELSMMSLVIKDFFTDVVCSQPCMQVTSS